MTMNTLEPMFTHSAAVGLEEPKLGDIDFDQASAKLRAATILPGRRCEARMTYRGLCPYEVIEAKEGQSVIIGQGEAFALNQSTEGMLLL